MGPFRCSCGQKLIADFEWRAGAIRPVKAVCPVCGVVYEKKTKPILDKQ